MLCLKIMQSTGVTGLPECSSLGMLCGRPDSVGNCAC